MSLGGGGYGGGGLPYAKETLQLWGGEMTQAPVATPDAPVVWRDDGTGAHEYTLIAVGAQGRRSERSLSAKANGFATLRWDSVPGADAYVVVRDGIEITPPVRMEGAQKEWTDTGGK